MRLINVTETLHVSLDFFGKFGGAKRNRTADLLHAMQALYQLSYNPSTCDAEF
jgi:hypothetical protein